MSAKINGWDERDYRLLGQIRQLPSYGIIAGNSENCLLSRVEVLRLLESAAEERAKKARRR